MLATLRIRSRPWRDEVVGSWEGLTRTFLQHSLGGVSSALLQKAAVGKGHETVEGQHAVVPPPSLIGEEAPKFVRWKRTFGNVKLQTTKIHIIRSKSSSTHSNPQ